MGFMKTLSQSSKELKDILDRLTALENRNILGNFPIGCIYLSVNSKNPSTLFGGTWTQLKDRFLLGVGDTYTINTVGGASSVSFRPRGTNGGTTLTVEQLPPHTHTVRQNSYNVGSGAGSTVLTYESGNVGHETSSTGSGSPHTHSFTGEKTTIETMPPYFTVYMWQRVA